MYLDQIKPIVLKGFLQICTQMYVYLIVFKASWVSSGDGFSPDSCFECFPFLTVLYCGD